MGFYNNVRFWTVERTNRMRDKNFFIEVISRSPSAGHREFFSNDVILILISELTNVLKREISEGFAQRFWVVDNYSEQTEPQSE